MIEINLYKKIIKSLPIVCVDVIIKNSKDQYLLVKRKNNPLKGQWWVVGGRIEHLEYAREAAIRKIKEEINLNIEHLIFEGVYEDKFQNNAFEEAPYHTVSLVFSCKIDNDETIILDNQSDNWIWSDKLPQRLIIRRD